MCDLHPQVSVIMSVYNGERYLKEAIQSIRRQTFTDFEFIVINDCSTDRTWEILNNYVQSDNRIVLLNNEENIGLTKSLNKGLKVARGKYIARQDADDIALPNRFEKQVAVLDQNLEVVLVSCDLQLVDDQGAKIGQFRRSCDSQLIPWYLTFYNHLAGHSQVLFRKESAVALNGYCESFRYAQDYEMWCRLVKVGKFEILPEILQQHRLHTQRVSIKKSSEQKEYALKQVKSNVAQLIAEEILSSEAEDLFRFWTGHWASSFPSLSKVDIVSERLNKIYHAYLNQNRSKGTYAQLEKSLKSEIEKQLLAWISVGGVKSLIQILLSRQALEWGFPFFLRVRFLALKKVMKKLSSFALLDTVKKQAV